MRPSACLALAILCASFAPTATAQGDCNSGVVFNDRNGNSTRDRNERGIGGVKVSDGGTIAITGPDGRYVLPPVAGRSTFVIKPPGYTFNRRADGLPAFWRNQPDAAASRLRYGGLVDTDVGCHDFALRKVPVRDTLDAWLFADPQAKSRVDVDHYARDIVAVVRADARPATLGLSLGDIVDDDLSLYPALNARTASIGVPWLHVPGNHDLDFDAADDARSLSTFRNTFGPDTVAWEEGAATFITLDDVVYRPGQTPAYIGGLRDEQFRFLEAYLPTVRRDGLLVIGVHIPFFDAAPGRETFRHADRARLFALLQPFPHVLLLSGHSHTQRHVLHGPSTGWMGPQPLHEYNVGAASGAFWSGAKDGAGIPDATMSDGTPNGYARLSVRPQGQYTLDWTPVRVDPTERVMRLHAPKVLRRGAYPAWGVYANVWMGREGTLVEMRIDGGDWQPMRRVVQPDPSLLAENARDDAAGALRGFDRSPEATPSTHLWRGALPTTLAVGMHRVDVRVTGVTAAPVIASTRYRLVDAQP